MDRIGHLNAMTPSGKTQTTSGVQPMGNMNIPIGKPSKNLSNGTLEALTNPQPGDFMYNLNRMSGLIDFNA